jgi:hypothetical protein
MSENCEQCCSECEEDVQINKNLSLIFLNIHIR